MYNDKKNFNVENGELVKWNTWTSRFDMNPPEGKKSEFPPGLWKFPPHGWKFSCGR